MASSDAASAIRQLADRLEQEYMPNVESRGASLRLSSSPTEVTVVVRDLTSARSVFSTSVPFARRLGWASTDIEPYRDPGEVERLLRAELDQWIAG